MGELRTAEGGEKFQRGDRSPYWPAGWSWHLPFPPGNAVRNLVRSAERHPFRPAMHYYGRTYSYGELLDKVTALAGFLQNRCDVARGDRVLLDIQNSPQFIIAFHAILRADAVVVPINPMSLAGELGYFASDSGARVAIIGNELLQRFVDLVPVHLDHVVVAYYADAAPSSCADPVPELMRMGRVPLPAGPFVDFADAFGAGYRPREIKSESDDIAVLPYSSGTTGKPKACIHRHSAITFTAAAQAKWYGLDETSVMTSFMPLFHVAGMQASMSAGLLSGAALVIMTRWDKDLIPVLFTRHNVTWWSAAPTMIVDVLASASFSSEVFAHLTVLTGGGASMPAALAEQLRGRYGLSFCEAYGLTETISATHINPLARPKPQCLGLPIFDTVSIVVDPETLTERPQGEVGEVLVSGPQIMTGYWRRSEATAEALVELNGMTFLRTGDLGYVDEEGYFFIVDRLKRMINVSGFKVWPAECEALLYHHPGIQECCVISAPDPYRGETVKALITPKPEYRGKLSGEDIITFSRKIMASYKVPRLIEFVDCLPRSSSGKIDWRKLQDLEWSGCG